MHSHGCLFASVFWLLPVVSRHPKSHKTDIHPQSCDHQEKGRDLPLLLPTVWYHRIICNLLPDPSDFTTRRLINTPSTSSKMFRTNANVLLRPILSRAATVSRIPSCICGGLGSAESGSRRNIRIEKRIEGLGIVLPTAPMPKANYNIVCIPPGENVMYLSGHLPVKVIFHEGISMNLPRIGGAPR